MKQLLALLSKFFLGRSDQIVLLSDQRKQSSPLVAVARRWHVTAPVLENILASRNVPWG